MGTERMIFILVLCPIVVYFGKFPPLLKFFLTTLCTYGVWANNNQYQLPHDWTWRHVITVSQWNISMATLLKEISNKSQLKSFFLRYIDVAPYLCLFFKHFFLAFLECPQQRHLCHHLQWKVSLYFIPLLHQGEIKFCSFFLLWWFHHVFAACANFLSIRILIDRLNLALILLTSVVVDGFLIH